MGPIGFRLCRIHSLCEEIHHHMHTPQLLIYMLPLLSVGGFAHISHKVRPRHCILGSRWQMVLGSGKLVWLGWCAL